MHPGRPTERTHGGGFAQEDEILKNLVRKQGARNWSLIAQAIPGRSGKSCRLRWCNQVRFCRYRFCELKYRGAVGRRQVHCTLIVKIIRFYC
jgi:myb proto-oncogene protein